MTDLDQAAALLEVDSKFFQPFDVTDPFNDDARLKGFFCQKPNHTYGALALLRVDGQPAPQRIFATPKLHYPFGEDGRFHFPAIHTAHLYEKLDGTNVLAYRYQDADGRLRLTLQAAALAGAAEQQVGAVPRLLARVAGAASRNSVVLANGLASGCSKSPSSAGRTSVSGRSIFKM